MKYFRAVNMDDVTDELYVSCNRNFDAKKAAEHLGLAEAGYLLVECSAEEFEAMTQEENDFIINVGQEKGNLEPFDSAHTEAEGIEKAKKYLEDWKCVEVVYMPVDNEDVNEIVWKKYNK